MQVGGRRTIFTILSRKQSPPYHQLIVLSCWVTLMLVLVPGQQMTDGDVKGFLMDMMNLMRQSGVTILTFN